MLFRTAGRLLPGVAAVGCVAPISVPDIDPPPTATVAPVNEAGIALPVVRLRLAGNGVQLLSGAELALFEGELTEQQLARFDPLALPKLLEQRRVPLHLWLEPSGDALVAAPLRVLDPGALYTLAARGLGRLLTFSVVESHVPTIERLWPPLDAPARGPVVLCTAQGFGEPAATALEPAGVPVTVTPHFGTHGGAPCARLDFDAAGLDGESLLLPPELNGISLAPTLLHVGAPSGAVELPVCATPEIDFGPGCATVEDDRLTVTNAQLPLLWRVETGALARLESVSPGDRFVLSGLQPSSELSLSGSVVSLDGLEASFSVLITTAPARPRVVLTEVLANPAGAEPAAEWVEIVNAGAAAVNLLGFTLADGAGPTPLPAARLAPGDYALIVRDDYAPGGTDVPPAPATLLIRVPQLGKSGLANAGEILSLSNPQGVTLSTFPALPARRAGVSMARRTPEAPDGEPTSFGEHAAPGASPGTANALASH